MKAQDAKRAAFLLEALENLKWEARTDHPEARLEKLKKSWEHNEAKPLPLMLDSAVTVDLDMAAGNGDDGDGSIATLARIDVGMMRKVVDFLINEIEVELRLLGVEIPPEDKD